MSVSGRSRALAHERQLIDGGDFQKRILMEQKGKLCNKKCNPKMVNHFKVETLYGDHKNRPVSV